MLPSSLAKGLSLTHSEAAVSSPAVATACPLHTGLTEGEALESSPRPPRWSADGNTMLEEQLGKGLARWSAFRVSPSSGLSCAVRKIGREAGLESEAE